MGFYTEQDLLTGKFEGVRFIVESNVVYYRPYVLLEFAGGTKSMHRFDTYSEAHEWGKAKADTCIINQLKITTHT